ncbi:class I adenylate-forming enzyme family protein [Bradyrhizobium liaoningense]|uniref:class I adenylate-forming enzyme family protein n=1 Tax=Bradyrhizobium liaoningense TaxID=43992 RepID=UPI001BADB3D2|nr:AMP-binding protein [Bradyrhizobium liaoningense]MBR0706963.1 AMP-binding protein [Bradyrhizobium liaoningense]
MGNFRLSVQDESGQGETVSVSSLGSIIRRQASLGAKVAFADADRSVTFSEFRQRVDRLVDSFYRLGLRPSNRIALLSRNCVGAVECIAAAKAGFIAVPLNWRLAPSELVALLRDCAPSALVCDAHWADIANAELFNHVAVPTRIALGRAPEGWLDFEDVVAAGHADAAHAEAEGSDTALLIYTSGTTGTPKAAMISHRGVATNSWASAGEAIGVTAADKVLCVMPLFHVGGLCYYLLPSYMAGATSILRPAFEVNDLVEGLATLAITNVHLVPTMISDLVAHPRAASAAASLKRIVYAGSTMPVALLERAMKAFPSCAFSQSYGLTEGGIVTTLGPEDHRIAATSETHARLLESCGRALSNTDLRLVDDNGADCKVGVPGEVLVRSERAMKGYWNSPDKTAKAFAGDYLRTGDIGYLDQGGHLYLIDRKNDMIVTGGENVFPSEVEQVLYRSPDVSEAAVFGIADARWIEKVVAAVVLRPGSAATPESIISFARQHLASYKCPKTVFLVRDLPRTGVGKISRKNLRQTFDTSPSNGSG